MKRILLTGAGSPAAQNFLQCLRMAPEQFYIVGCDMNRYHLEWGDLDAAYVAPPSGTPEYIAFLNRISEREQIDFLHGQSDYDVSYLSEHAKELKVRTFYPNAEVVALAQDKYAACSRWADAGLRNAPKLLHQVTITEGCLPLWMRLRRGAGAQGSCKVQSAEQAQAWFSFWRTKGFDPCDFMVEGYLPGCEYAFSSLWYQGELVCSSARERLEFVFPQHAPSGVTSSPVVARTVHNDAVNEIATKAIITLDGKPHGIYSVDLKEDSDGVPRPTECNAGRFFTTSRFLEEGGCNMPYWFTTLGAGDMETFFQVRDILQDKKYNAIPAGLYWIRHIDCGSVLRREDELRAIVEEKGIQQ